MCTSPEPRGPTCRKRIQVNRQPSQYTLLSAHPNKAAVFPSQCTSMLTEGQTLSWFTSMASGSSMSTTTVFTSSATMFAGPVNGFNIATSTQATATDSAAAGTQQTTTPSSTQTSSSSQSPQSSASSASTSTLGLSIGITLGIVFAVLLLGIAGFILWRRRRSRLAQDHSRGRHLSASPDKTELEYEGSAPVFNPTQHSNTLEELPVTKWISMNELPVAGPRSVNELESRSINELPVAEPRSIYELPGRWER